MQYNIDLIDTPDRSRLYEFIVDSSRRISWAYMGMLFLGFAASTGVYLTTQNAVYEAIWPSQTVYYLLLGLHIIFRVRQSRANMLSPDMLFVVFYTIVHLGYVTLYSLKIVPQSEQVFYYEQSIPRSMYVVNLGFLGFLCGYELMGLRASTVTILSSIEMPRFSWEAAGILFMVLSVAMHCIGLTLLGWDVVFRSGKNHKQKTGKCFSDSFGLAEKRLYPN